jgi:hypothetical protein
LDGENKDLGDDLHLTYGWHQIQTVREIRLCLDPPGWKEVADPQYAERQPLFDSPYRY